VLVVLTSVSFCLSIVPFTPLFGLTEATDKIGADVGELVVTLTACFSSSSCSSAFSSSSLMFLIILSSYEKHWCRRRRVGSNVDGLLLFFSLLLRLLVLFINVFDNFGLEV
jgi:hypothetical protein